MNILYKSKDNKYFLGYDDRNYVFGKIVIPEKSKEETTLATNWFTQLSSAILFAVTKLSGKEAKSLEKYAVTLENIWTDIIKSTRLEFKEQTSEKLRLTEWDEEGILID